MSAQQARSSVASAAGAAPRRTVSAVSASTGRRIQGRSTGPAAGVEVADLVVALIMSYGIARAVPTFRVTRYQALRAHRAPLDHDSGVIPKQPNRLIFNDNGHIATMTLVSYLAACSKQV